MVYYSELDNSNICTCVSELNDKVSAPSMIEIPSFDTELVGKKYVNGG